MPDLAQCSIVTMTRLPLPTRSIAPPIPLTIFLGIIQFARSPLAAHSREPRTVRSMCFPRIIANDSEEVKVDAPGIMVMVSFPALMRSGSAPPAGGYCPMPTLRCACTRERVCVCVCVCVCV